MRETLQAFIEAVRAEKESRAHFCVGVGNGYPKVWFGYGYFKPSGCLLWVSESEFREVSDTEALDALFPKESS